MIYMYVCIYMRDEKEERKKEASKVKQTNKAKQYMYMVERSVWSAECVMGSNSFRRKRTSLNAVYMALLASFFLPSLINTCKSASTVRRSSAINIKGAVRTSVHVHYTLYTIHVHVPASVAQLVERSV